MPLEGQLPLKGRKFKQASSVSRLATKDQLEVCPLSRGMMFQPLSEPLQPGIRFFQPPIPAQPTAFLAVRLPEPTALRQPYGLTTFPARYTTGLGPASSPVIVWRRTPTSHRSIQPRTFWLVPVSSLGTAMLTTFISSSLTLPLPASLAPRPMLLRSSTHRPHDPWAPLRGLRCQESFKPHRYQ